MQTHQIRRLTCLAAALLAAAVVIVAHGPAEAKISSSVGLDAIFKRTESELKAAEADGACRIVMKYLRGVQVPDTLVKESILKCDRTPPTCRMIPYPARMQDGAGFELCGVQTAHSEIIEMTIF